MKLVEVIFKKCGAKLGKGGHDHRFGICDKHVNEALDDYDRALRKALLLVSEVFPYQFKRSPEIGTIYKATRPDNNVEVNVAITGLSVRIDVYFRRSEYLNSDELSDALNELKDKLAKISGSGNFELSDHIVNVSDKFHLNKDRAEGDKLNRRFTKIIPVSIFLKQHH